VKITVFISHSTHQCV